MPIKDCKGNQKPRIKSSYFNLLIFQRKRAPVILVISKDVVGPGRLTVDGQRIFTIRKQNPQTPVQVIRNTLQGAVVDVSVTAVHRRLHKQNYTARCKPLVIRKNSMARLWLVKKYLKEPAEFCLVDRGTGETNIALYQSDGKHKMWRLKGDAQEPKLPPNLKACGYGGLIV